jgi:hypothetical protein
MWELQGMLLYRSIEHRNRAKADRRDGIREEDLTPYADFIRDPRVNPEEAKKIAA